jgi:uncharacterized membrane protein
MNQSNHARAATLVVSLSTLCALLAPWAAQAQTAAPAYTITTLAKPSSAGYKGIASVSPEKINNQGQVVGYASLITGYKYHFYTVGGAIGLYTYKTPIVRNVPLSWADGKLTVLSRTATNQSALALSINDAGTILGTSAKSALNGTQVPVLWKNGTRTPQSLGPVVVGITDINNQGWILGAPENSGIVRPLVWKAGQVELLDPTKSGANIDHCNMERFSDNGEIVCKAFVYRGPGEAGTYRSFVWRSGTFTEITYPGAYSIEAYPISRNGTVAGTITMESERSELYSYSKPFIWRNGELTILPSLPGATSAYFPRIVNNEGMVIGSTSRGESPYGFSTLWTRQGAVDLSAPILQAIGPDEYLIRDMNDRGQILISGAKQNVVLTPTTP